MREHETKTKYISSTLLRVKFSFNQPLGVEKPNLTERIAVCSILSVPFDVLCHKTLPQTHNLILALFSRWQEKESRHRQVVNWVQRLSVVYINKKSDKAKRSSLCFNLSQKPW